MSEELKERAIRVKAVVFDCDGVFFTGRVFVHPKDGESFKERSFVDSQGIALLRSAGIAVAFVTAEKSGFIEAVAEKWNKLPSVVEGKWKPLGVFSGASGHEKVAVIEHWLAENGVSWEECAYMGDDLSDYEIMQKAGFPTAPIQAEKEIKELAVFVTTRRGGDGAIRDLVNLILEAKEINKFSLARR